ncbi:unnamed protein product [Closterium sp. Naga37s-1]|nr:unnamed protein product [Closterium sp. Naga37s-1]
MRTKSGGEGVDWHGAGDQHAGIRDRRRAPHLHLRTLPRRLSPRHLRVSEIGDERPISSCALSPDASLVATSGWSGACRFWSQPAVRAAGALRSHSERATCVAWHPHALSSLPASGPNLATAGADSVRLFPQRVPSSNRRGGPHMPRVRSKAMQENRLHPRIPHPLSCAPDHRPISSLAPFLSSALPPFLCPAFPPLLPLIYFTPFLPLIFPPASPHFLLCFPSFPPLLPLISLPASPHFPHCCHSFLSLLPLISPTAATHFSPCFSSFFPASHHFSLLLIIFPCFSSFPSLLLIISLPALPYVPYLPCLTFFFSPSQSLLLSPSSSLLQ